MDGKYKRLSVLGKGGFGTTYLVQDTYTGEKYAVKHIQYGSKSELAYIYREFEIMSHLRHPNVVQCYECTVEAQECRIRMEYAQGGDLSAYIKAGMSLQQIRGALCYILLALDYLHQKKHIMHRDIKQHNVLVNKGLYYLCDFGVSKILQNTNADARTRCGTPMFFAPEMVAGRPYTSKCDIWSCGIMLYYMLNRQYPFEGTTGADVFKEILNCPEHIPVSSRTSEDERLAGLCRQMLAKDADSRPSARRVLISGVFDLELRYLSKIYRNKHFDETCVQIDEILDRILPSKPEIRRFVDPEVMEKKEALIYQIGQDKFNYIVTQLSLGKFLSEAAEGLSVEKKLLFKEYVEFIIYRRRADSKQSDANVEK